MLSDPLVISNGTQSITMPRSSGSKPGARRMLGQSTYSTPDGEYRLFVRRDHISDDSFRVEVLLEKNQLDPNGPFVGNHHSLPNRFGFVIETNDLFYNSKSDVASLRGLLSSFVDDTIINRLIGGEL